MPKTKPEKDHNITEKPLQEKPKPTFDTSKFKGFSWHVHEDPEEIRKCPRHVDDIVTTERDFEIQFPVTRFQDHYIIKTYILPEDMDGANAFSIMKAIYEFYSTSFSDFQLDLVKGFANEEGFFDSGYINDKLLNPKPLPPFRYDPETGDCSWGEPALWGWDEIENYPKGVRMSRDVIGKTLTKMVEDGIQFKRVINPKKVPKYKIMGSALFFEGFKVKIKEGKIRLQLQLGS